MPMPNLPVCSLVSVYSSTGIMIVCKINTVFVGIPNCTGIFANFMQTPLNNFLHVCLSMLNTDYFSCFFSVSGTDGFVFERVGRPGHPPHSPPQTEIDQSEEQVEAITIRITNINIFHGHLENAVASLNIVL